MEIKTLQDVSDKDILDVFNLSFSDYRIPFQLTLDQLQGKMKSDNVNLDLSVGTFESNKLVGFILHGQKTRNGLQFVYNGGTGVIPTHRGNGLTYKMHDFILSQLKSKGIDGLVLEVISDNIPAIKSYEKVGYKTMREVGCYKGELNCNRNNDGVEVTKFDAFDWPLFKSFWDFSPTTQNSPAALEAIKESLIILGAQRNNSLSGYLIYNPKSKRVQQFAVSKDFRREKIATSLFGYVAENYGQACSLINIDKRSLSTIKFLNGIGLDAYLSQFEMEMLLG